MLLGLLSACLCKCEETGVTSYDTPSDEDDDAATTEETGIAQFFLVGEFTTKDGAYVDASFGYGFRGIAVDDWVCTTVGTLPYEGPAPDGCPNCDWAFDLGPIASSVASGDACEDFGISDGYAEGYVDYVWGFAEEAPYEYGGDTFYVENALFVAEGTGTWTPVAFNYGGRSSVSGDASHVSLEGPAFADGAYVYYYYWP